MYNKELPTISNMGPLTPEQISLIKTTWAIPAQNPIDSGEAVLYAFFEKYPSNQQKFLAFKNVPLPELKVHKNLEIKSNTSTPCNRKYMCLVQFRERMVSEPMPAV